MKWSKKFAVELCLSLFVLVSVESKSSDPIVKTLQAISKTGVYKLFTHIAGAWTPAESIFNLISGALAEEPEDKFIGVNVKLDDISGKLDNIGRQIESHSLNILSEIKFAGMKNFWNRIESVPSRFRVMIEGARDNDDLLRQLNDFIDSFSRNGNMEYEMVQYLITGGPSSPPLVNDFINAVKNKGQNNFLQYQSSPSSMIYELHISVLNMVLKLTTYLSMCQTLKDRILGSKF
jgi:hypothetical protein